MINPQLKKTDWLKEKGSIKGDCDWLWSRNDQLRGGAGRKTVLLLFQPTHSIVHYMISKKNMEKKQNIFFPWASFPWKWPPSFGILGHSPRYI